MFERSVKFILIKIAWCIYLEKARKLPLLDPKVDMATDSGIIQAIIPSSFTPNC